MTNELLVSILIAAFGIASSPVPIMAVIMVLGTSNDKANALRFVFGWLVGLSALSLLLLIFAEAIYLGETGQLIMSWVRVVLGVGLLALAIKKWIKRPKKEEKITQPKILMSINSMKSKQFLGLGLALGGINPKNIAFSLVAITAIAEASVSLNVELLILAGFIFLSSLLVLMLVGGFVVMGEKAEKMLAKIQDWMSRNNTFIMVGLYLVFGFLLLRKGLEAIL